MHKGGRKILKRSEKCVNLPIFCKIKMVYNFLFFIFIHAAVVQWLEYHVVAVETLVRFQIAAIMVKNSKFEFFLKTFFNESGDVKNIEIFLDKLSEETIYVSVKNKKKFLSLESKIGRKSFIKAKELIQKLNLWKLSQEKAKKNSLIKSKLHMKLVQKKLLKKIQKKY